MCILFSYITISCDSESLAFFDGAQDHLFGRLFVLVLRKIELIDASVRLWQPVLVCRVNLGDRELLKSCLASESFEAFNRHFAASCHELNELCTFTVVKLLQRLPQILYWLRVCSIPYIDCILTEVVNVYHL